MENEMMIVYYKLGLLPDATIAKLTGRPKAAIPKIFHRWIDYYLMDVRAGAREIPPALDRTTIIASSAV